MDKINFYLLNDELQNEWDQYVFNSVGSSYVHHSAWRETIENVYGHKSYYIMAFCKNKVVGVLPLFLISIPLMGKLLASGLYSSYGGICADNVDVAGSLMNEAENLANSLDVKYLEVKNYDNYNLMRNKGDKYLNYYTMVLKLDKNPENVWNSITKKARQNIRKATNSGIKIVSGNEYFDEFYKLISVNMKQLGTPVHSRKFYKSILDKFDGDAELYIAKLSNETVSVALTIKYGKFVFGYANAAHSNYLTYKPNFLIYWEIIKSMANSGVEYFDLGRSLIDSGTYNFKLNFGAYPVQLYYDYYLNKITDVPNINQENKSLKIAANVWSHLPLSLTKLIGPHLIKYIP